MNFGLTYNFEKRYKMEIKYQLFTSQKLLIQKFIGVFSFEHYMRYNAHLMNTLDSNCFNKILIDFREIIFESSNKEFKDNLAKVAEIRKKIIDNQTDQVSITHVFWVDKPLPTAVAQLFKSRFPTLNYNTCSTEAHVLANFNFDKKRIDLIEMIDNLRDTFY